MDKLFYSYTSNWSNITLESTRNVPNSIVFHPQTKRIMQNGVIYGSGENGAIFIKGSGSTANGQWLGTSSQITEYFEGLTVIYVPDRAGGSSTTTLNINGYGAATCYYSNDSKLTTHYSANTPILFTYMLTTTGVGMWKRADYNYNINTFETCTYHSSTNQSYYISFFNRGDATIDKQFAYTNGNLRYNPYTNILTSYIYQTIDKGPNEFGYFYGNLVGTADHAKKSDYAIVSSLSDENYKNLIILKDSYAENTYLMLSASKINNSYAYTYVDSNLYFNHVTNTLKTDIFEGNLNGNASSANYAINADNSKRIQIYETGTNQSYYITFVNENNGYRFSYVNGDLLYNPNSHTLSTINANFSGQITSTVAGNTNSTDNGLSPFVITSTKLNENLNADLLDNYQANEIENIYHGAWCAGSGTYYGKVAEYKYTGTSTVDLSATFLISRYATSGNGTVNILNIRGRGSSKSDVTCTATWSLNTNNSIPITITHIHDTNDGNYYIRIYFKSTGWGETYGCKLLNSHAWNLPNMIYWTLYNGMYTSSTSIQSFTDIPSNETVIPISNSLSIYNAAAKLSTTSNYTAWGATFWENGLPKTITDQNITGTKNITPNLTNNYTLGSTDKRWLNIYSAQGNFTGQIETSVTGVPPFIVSSNKRVDNLYAEYAQKIQPLYEATFNYTCTANNANNAWIFFGNIIPESTYWTESWYIYYTLEVTTTEENTQGYYDVIVGCSGSAITYKVFNRFYSSIYYPIYAHALLYHSTKAMYTNRETYPAKIGVRVESSRTPTSLARTYNIKVWKLVNCTFSFPDNIETRVSVYNSANNAITSLNGTSLGLQESGDLTDITTMQLTYSKIRAGANGIMQYSLIMQDGTGTWQSFTTTSGYGTKTKNTTGFRLGSRIYYMNISSNIAANTFIGTSQVRAYNVLVDLRYSLNITANSLGNGLTYGKPVYIVGTLGNDELFYLDNNWWTQDEPTTDDGKIYIRVVEAVYNDYNTSTMPSGNYRGDLISDGYAFWYKDGLFRRYGEGGGYSNKLYIKQLNIDNNYPLTFVNPNANDEYSNIFKNYDYITWNPFRHSLSNGQNCQALGTESHAEGSGTISRGIGSHTEGLDTETVGRYSHAEGDGTTANGYSSHTEGSGTTTIGDNSHAEGYGTQSTGNNSHAEGSNTIASGIISHSEGCNTSAGDYSHAEGYNTIAESSYTHTEGYATEALAYCAHAEGFNTQATARYSHAEGYCTDAEGFASHVEGRYSISSGDHSHAEGYQTKSRANNSHTEGANTITQGQNSHAEGYCTYALAGHSHSEGAETIANGIRSHSEGSGTQAVGNRSHAEGNDTVAFGYNTHSEGMRTVAFGKNSHAEGYGEIKKLNARISGNSNDNIYSLNIYGNIELNNDDIILYIDENGYKHVAKIINIFISSGRKIHFNRTLNENGNISNGVIYKVTGISIGNHSHSEGQKTIAYGQDSHSEGEFTVAYGENSHAEGSHTYAMGENSHAEGINNYAFGNGSHAEGSNNQSFGFDTHTEGFGNTAGIQGNEVSGESGQMAHAEGYETSAVGTASHSEGKYTKAFAPDSHAEGYETTVSNLAIAGHAEGNKTQVLGKYGHAEGYKTIAAYLHAHAEGSYTVAYSYSHAEGYLSYALAYYSHAEGYDTISNGDSSHAEGYDTISNGDSSHAEGSRTISNGDSSHAEGYDTISNGWASHAEGSRTISRGIGSHTEGLDTETVGQYSHAEGDGTTANGYSSHAEGSGTTANGYSSHTEGSGTAANGYSSHTEGSSTIADGDYSHAEGYNTTASQQSSHAEGNSTTASGESSHAEGNSTTASGNYSHAEGKETTASGIYSHTEGYNTTASQQSSHAEGNSTTASNNYAHAEGYNTTASGESSHAEGNSTTASGNYSHAEGSSNTASGVGAHAEGTSTTASGNYSHTSGFNTIASHNFEYALGHYNVSNSDTIFSIGGGDSNSNRFNLLEVTTAGNATLYNQMTSKGYIHSDITGATTLADKNTYVLLGGGSYKKISDFVQITGSTMTGNLINVSSSTGSATIIHDLDNIVIATKQTRANTLNYYHGGIAFNHMYNFNNGTNYNTTAHAWIGTRLHSISGSETSYLIFATKSNTDNTARPVERMCIHPNGNVGINTQIPTEKLHISGNEKIEGNIFIDTGDLDRYIQFNYNNNNYAGASWRLLSRGTGAGDTNYFDIETGGSTASATTWNRVLRLTMNTRRVGINTDTVDNTLDVNGIAQIYQRGNDNTAFKNLLLIKQQNSLENLNDSWTATDPTFGIGFNRYWTNSNGAYGETNCAGIYATVSSTWKGGLVFRTKNNTTQGGTHDISALRLAPSGKAYFVNQIVSSLDTGTSPFAVTSTTVNTNLNADMVDGEHNYHIKAYPTNEGEIVWTSLPYLDNNSASLVPPFLATPSVSIKDAPYGVSFGPITSYAKFYSDFILVKPGDILYGEILAYRETGARGTAGTLYYGIQRYDRNKYPITSNNGMTYFVANGVTVSTDGQWHKYYGTYTVPESHTPYTANGNTSDGGGVYYIKIAILVNYNSGTIPTYIGSALLKRLNTTTKLLVTQTTNDTNYPLVFTTDDDATGYKDFYKNYNNIYWNPNKKAFAHGDNVTASGLCSTAEGINTTAGPYSHAEGSSTIASGDTSHAEGYLSQALGIFSHAEGNNTIANNYAHSEGNSTTASGESSHAEGNSTTASGNYSHAEGTGTIASGLASHAEGNNTLASGFASHAQGQDTIASHNYEFAAGFFNVSSNDTRFSIGGGTDNDHRSNLFEVKTTGNAHVKNNLYAEQVSVTSSSLSSGITKFYVGDDNFIKYISLNDLKTLFFGSTNAVGSNEEPIYWDGNQFKKAQDRITISKTLTITEAWMDTGIITNAETFTPGSGTYVLQISSSNVLLYSGIIAIMTSGVNGTDTEEIVLHCASSSAYKRLYVRTQNTNSGYAKIQIAAESNYSSSQIFEFKFRKLL